MVQLLVIGGSDAGISAALRAREVDAETEVTIVVADSFPNYSVCGIPFFLSGEVPDWHQLAHRTQEEITRQGIQLVLDHTAQAIDPIGKRVTIIDSQGGSQELRYDRLIIGTGATPIRPDIAGIDSTGVFLLRSMADSLGVDAYLHTVHPRSAAIIGGGYIGVEMADALTHRGLQVRLIEHSGTVLKTLDPSLGQLVGAELQRHGVEVVNGTAITAIAAEGSSLVLTGTDDFRAMADLVIVSTGVQPVTELAKTAGIATGLHGAIRVSRTMRTNLSDVYAAGDCVETWHRLFNEYVYLPLGSTAHKQGRIAGENAVGGHREFAGTLGTQVVKVFDLAVTRTGLLETEAQRAGFKASTVELTAWDHKVYYPGAHPLTIRLTGDEESGRLLGAQIVGHWQGEVAKRIDIYAAALFHGMLVEDLNALDLSYTPPLGSPWDAVQVAAQTWERARTQPGSR